MAIIKFWLFCSDPVGQQNTDKLVPNERYHLPAGSPTKQLYLAPLSQYIYTESSEYFRWSKDNEDHGEVANVT